MLDLRNRGDWRVLGQGEATNAARRGHFADPIGGRTTTDWRLDDRNSALCIVKKGAIS